MPYQSPVGEIRHTDYQVKDVTDVCSFRVCDRGHNGLLWVHHIVVINTISRSGSTSTTIQTPEGEVVTINMFFPILWLNWTMVGLIVGFV